MTAGAATCCAGWRPEAGAYRPNLCARREMCPCLRRLCPVARIQLVHYCCKWAQVGASGQPQRRREAPGHAPAGVQPAPRGATLSLSILRLPFGAEKSELARSELAESIELALGKLALGREEGT